MKLAAGLLALALALSCGQVLAAPAASNGFVKTSGTRFTLNGSKYTVVGENAYWVGLMGYSTSDMHQAFSDIAKAGGTTVRTWGFNEVTSKSGNYYQSWSGSTPTINYGPSGLENFDNVVAAAKANGIHLIVTLTNNWSAYGGMDTYTKQILNSEDHDLFYTNSKVINAYKNYVKAFVGRYVDNPTIMAWELANEPQCTGNTNQWTGTCTTTTITNWVKEMSAYIKSIDRNHLVAIGDCGFYNRAGQSSVYDANDGVDFDNQLPISTLDFGTVHLYPESWGVSGDQTSWGSEWIANHVTNQNKVGKPVILEEFGIPTNQAAVYTTWLNEVVSSGLAGDLIWQAGSHFPGGVTTPTDGLAVYPGTQVYSILQSHAAKMKSRG